MYAASLYCRYDQDEAYRFLKQHGLAVRAFGIVVDDAAEAFAICTRNGGVPVAAPVTRADPATGASLTWAEVKLYGDCVLRFVSGDFEVRPAGGVAARAGVPRGARW